jgi:tetratricopeptide (TPR) repeat protein
MFTKEQQDCVKLILNLINTKNFFEAEDQLKKLIVSIPDNYLLYNLKGIICSEKKFYTKAIEHFKEAIKLNSNFFVGYYNIGCTYMKMKDHSNAIIFFKNALKNNHSYYDAYFNLADCYREIRQFDESLNAFFECLKIKRDDANIYNNLGLIYFAKNELDKAENYFLESIKFKPDLVQPHYNLGLILNRKNQYTRAIIFFNKAIKLDKYFCRAYSHIAISYAKTGDYNNAINNINNSIKLSPEDAHGYHYRGIVYSIFKKKDLALIDYDKAIEINPSYSEVFVEKGILQESLHKFKDAEKCYDEAIKYNSLDPIPKFNKSLLNLKLKNFIIGWREYEWRKKLNTRYLDHEQIKNYDTFKLPTFKELKNKKIFIYCEQGIGDIIQFSRYIKILSDQKTKITFKINKKLTKLFEDFNNYCKITSDEVDIASFDYVCSLLSLPLIFSNSDINLFNQDPYLKVNKSNDLSWKNRLHDNNFKIGVNWRSVKNFISDKNFDLDLFSDISTIKNVTLINLQKDFDPMVDNKNKNIKIKFFSELDKGEDAFFDSAAIINNLDLIISNDTSIAHLAGAIGKPIWLVLNYTADWRWFLDDKESPWYPSMLIFRQKIDGSWIEPFSEIKNCLKDKLLSAK